MKWTRPQPMHFSFCDLILLGCHVFFVIFLRPLTLYPDIPPPQVCQHTSWEPCLVHHSYESFIMYYLVVMYASSQQVSQCCSSCCCQSSSTPPLVGHQLGGKHPMFSPGSVQGVTWVKWYTTMTLKTRNLWELMANGPLQNCLPEEIYICLIQSEVS